MRRGWLNCCANLAKGETMKRTSALIILACLLYGCSHYLVGKTMNPNYCYPLQADLTRHYIEYEWITFDYGFDIDDQNHQITFDGDVKLKPAEIPGGNRLIQLKVDFIFCDENYKAIASEYFMIYDTSTEKTLRFRKTYPYREAYSYLAVDCSGIVD